MESIERTIGKTSRIPNPNQYVLMLQNEYFDWAFDEVRAPQFRGKWRQEVFRSSEATPVDLEIGTGNGFHFGHHAQTFGERNLVGIEIKYKPLIQAIRRPVKAGCTNARMVRYDATLVEHLFGQNELDNIYIHFPDPWELGPQWKHRLISDEFLNKIYSLQRPGSYVEFKTDSESYFRWALPRFLRSQYQICKATTDLHECRLIENNFITAFENIFLRKGQPIFYLLAQKN